MRLADLTDRIVSASATIIAIIALSTGAYQAKLSRDQAHASVWPYLLVGNSGNNGYAFIVQNVGIGPAIVKRFDVSVDGKPMQDWPGVAKALQVPITFSGSRSTSFHRGIVIPAGSTVDLLELPDSTDVRLMRSRLEHLAAKVCFCSFYGDCWVTTFGLSEPMPVKSCPDEAPAPFRS